MWRTQKAAPRMETRQSCSGPAMRWWARTERSISRTGSTAWSVAIASQSRSGQSCDASCSSRNGASAGGESEPNALTNRTRRGNRAAFGGKDGLVPLSVRRLDLPLDVRRQRRLADLVDLGVQLVVRTVEDKADGPPPRGRVVDDFRDEDDDSSANNADNPFAIAVGPASGRKKEKTGYVLCHQPKSFDWRIRKSAPHPAGRLAAEPFHEVCGVLNQIMQLA